MTTAIGSATSKEIVALALECGFHRAGTAAAGPSVSGDRFRAWLARGNAAGMDYLGRTADARGDVRERFPWARTVIVVALRYGPDRPETGLASKIARYAQGRDYHKVMEERLDRFRDALRERFPESRCRHYVDTGPVLEREWAVRAGLGWVGKNNCLIHPEEGSWCFLGVVLTDLEIPSVAPEIPDQCGACTLCLDACPTEALVAARELDARKCIAYWSIEHRGGIPSEIADGMGDDLFGCDICQEACPWNDAAPPGDPELATAPVLAARTTGDLARMTRAEYEAWFRGSPLRRAGLAGLRRNGWIGLRHEASSDRVARAE